MQNAREKSSFGSHPDDAAVAQERLSKCLDLKHFDALGVQNEQAISAAINPDFSRSLEGVLDTLTAAQQAVLDYIQSFILAKGFPPTRAEISQHFGWRSANAAHDHVFALERKGRVRVERGQSRGIRVIPPITETLKLPDRSAIQLQAIEVRKIWDSEGCHSTGFPDALARLLEMIESGN